MHEHRWSTKDNLQGTVNQLTRTIPGHPVHTLSHNYHTTRTTLPFHRYIIGTCS